MPGERAWSVGTGVVAIISPRRDVRIKDEEVEGLATAYEALRGRATRHTVGAGDWARVVKLAGPGDRGDSGSSGPSWAVSTGVVHGDGPLSATAPERLDGQFSLFAFDSQTDTLVVATDPFGMHALYLADREGKTYVSTSALALARYLRTSPSRLGVSAFLRTGYQFGTSTLWEGIERFDPGTCIRFVPRNSHREVYWRPTRDERVAGMPFDHVIDHCIEVAVDSFRSLLGDRPVAWSDLTGGYDSRLLNVLLDRAGVPFITNTRDEEAQDIKLAPRVAASAGWPTFHVSLPDDWDRVLPEMLPTALAWADGNLEVLELSWVLWAHRRLRERHASLLSAGGGEHFQYAAWKSEFLDAGRSTEVNLDNFISMRLLRPIDGSILARDQTAEIKENFRSRLAAWGEPYSSELNTTQLDVLFAYKSMGHFGAYHSADYAVLTAELPFYLKPVFTAAFSADYRHRNNHRLMRHMIHRLAPRVAAVATTKGGTAEPWRLTNLHRFLPYYGTLGRKAINKLTQRAGFPILPTVAHFDPAALASRRGVLRSLSSSGHPTHRDLRSAPLFKPKALDEFLARAGETRQSDITLLGRILTIELALRAADAGLG